MAKLSGRTEKSMLNALASCSSYLVLMLSTFVTRAVFKRMLGLEYSGVETVFMNIITMLSIVELGIGSGIVYKLYKPIADGDYRKIGVLINFYKKAYIIISSILAALGLIFAFVSPVFVKAREDGSFDYLWLVVVFILYVLDALVSYLYAHKRAMFTADQRNYVTVITHTASQVVMGIVQIVMLIVMTNFIGKAMSMVLYVVIKITARLVENLVLSSRYDRRYGKDVDLKLKERLPAQEKSELLKNIRALLMHKIAGKSLTTTPSIIISYFVDTVSAGIYGNYTMITYALTMLCEYFFNGITASFGNLMSTASSGRVVQNYNKLFLTNFFISSFFAGTFFNLAQPFVRLWIGADGLFPLLTVVLLSLYLYMMTMRQSIFMARSSAGQYQQDRWFAIIEAAINLTCALVLVRFLGINGVIIANIISLICVPMWTQPRIVYRDVLHIKVVEYYKKYIMYFVLFAGYTASVYGLRILINSENLFINLLVSVIFSVVVINGMNILIFHRTSEFSDLKKMLFGILRKFKPHKA